MVVEHERYTLYRGDCLEALPTLAAGSVDSVICDPPYGLSFMGKDWDHGVPGPRFWREALRVAKPGAFLFAFGGTRTFHRLACAIEDAGWEIRDCIMWVYGSGFPKSHNISKAIDKAAGAEREVVGRYDSRGKYDSGERSSNGVYTGGITNDKTYGPKAITAPATEAAQTWDGYGTALKPAWEPIIVAMKPLDGTFANNALEHGVAGLWIDGARVGFSGDGDGEWTSTPGRGANGKPKGQGNAYGYFGAKAEPKDNIRYNSTGRWPANLIHDGSDEVVGGFPNRKGGNFPEGGKSTKPGTDAVYGRFSGNESPARKMGDSGSAARFFYCAKASRSERTHNGAIENKHPTVKPLALMRYLCRLTKTPTGGNVLDLFMGSGSTGVAALLERCGFIGIEQGESSFETAAARLEMTATDATQEPLPL